MLLLVKKRLQKLITLESVSYTHLIKEVTAVIPQINSQSILKYKEMCIRDRLQITAPSVNKGEIYTFTGNSKTIYYPSLKQTVKQKIQKDEANILGVFNKLSKLTSKKTQTKGNDTFVFTNNWLTSIKSGGVTVGFSDYKKVGEYTYPTKIFVTDGNSRVVYYLSNFK